MELSSNNGPLDEPIVIARSAEEGCSVRQGPPHAMSLSWLVSVQGSEYVALVLWIGQDWSWSQLGWTTSAFIFGTCAALWIVLRVIVSLHSRLFSETYQGIVLLLWLLGLYAWMTGEFWTLWYSEEFDHHAIVFEQRGNSIARKILLTAVFLDAVYFFILVRLDVFAADRQDVGLRRLEGQRPPCPQWAASYFKEFRVYSSVHFFTWALKDCMWAWELPVAYGIFFVITILINVDLLWRLGTHRDLYIDFVNYSVTLMWVTANGLWAFGELVANSDATEDQFRRYTWPRWHVIHGASFQFRYCAGWMFLLSALCLFVFYVHWIVLTARGKLPSFKDFNKEEVLGII